MRKAMVGVGLAAALFVIAPAAFATTYYGPSFSLPTAITPGSNINIVLSTASGSTFTAAPSGSNTPCVGTCTYTLRSCTDPTQFYVAIHEITVTDPSGNEYMLGSAATSGVYWPANQGGGEPNSGPTHNHANELNITVGQTDTVVFGTGAGGMSFASENYHTTAPFTAVADTAGSYYWWTVAGNSWGSNLRLDQNPTITPTTTHGTYILDIEGVAVCGGTTTQVSAIVFFDAPISVITPEFGASVIAVAGIAFVLMMLVRRNQLSRKVSAV